MSPPNTEPPVDAEVDQLGVKRPPVVWAFVIFELVSSGVGLVENVLNDRVPIWAFVLSIPVLAIFLALIWNRSRIGWSVMALLSTWAIADYAIHHDTMMAAFGISGLAMRLAGFLLLVNPWMIRWVWWRDMG